MGGPSWSDDHYKSSAAIRAKTGASAFSYTESIKAGKTTSKTHDDLNPFGIKRESRDSDPHPHSNAIGIIFDVTGSMLDIPVKLQAKLPNLLGMLTRKAYISDPQILFGGLGDVFYDKSPLQVGQFESGNEMEGDLSKIYLEGGGGGNNGESYDLALYFFANKTSIDCFEKRGKKGYLFTIGDENIFDATKADTIKKVFGDEVSEDVPIRETIKKLKEKYYYFHILPTNAYHSNDSSITARWRSLIGQNLLVLDNPDAVCEVIALAIGLNEDSISMDDIAGDMSEFDIDQNIIESASKTVATLGTGLRTTGEFPEVDSYGGVERL